ncbi:MAG: hypothetical protein WC582_02975 [Patescibacteria group bacterium]|jgi:hypothetical protein
MLIKKKIEKGRLIIYIVIIAIMFGGAIFFIYKNYSLGRGEGAMVIEAPAETELENSNRYNLDKLSENISLIKEQPAPPAEKNIISPVIKDSGGASLIDLSLLSALKFKMLKEDILKSQEFKPGKSNPFAPY